MDLGSRLANLSLAEIASMLNTKQQEVLLASISVAARFIQQLQAEEQLHQAQEEQDRTQYLGANQAKRNQSNNINNNQNSNSNSIINQTNNSEAVLNLLTSASLNSQTANLANQTTNTSQLIQSLHHHNNNNHNNHHHHNNSVKSETPTDHIDEDDFDELDDDDDDQEHINDQSSDISFEEYSPLGPIDHSSTADKQVLLTIREFAEELKSRRKSIRLSQKGAAQSLRAFTSGDQPCTDAIIYHFENLQLEPDRAIQLIPLLRDWLEWAEKYRLNGKQLPMLSAVTKVPRERKRKVVLFNEKAKQYLEDAFVKNNHPDRYQLDVISQELNIPTRSIRKWFTNRRQRKRFAEKFSTVQL